MPKENLPLEIETNFDFDSYTWILECLKLIPKCISRRRFHQVVYKYKREEMVELCIINLLDLKTVYVGQFSSKQFDLIENSNNLEKSLESFAENWRDQTLSIINSLYKEKEKKKIFLSPSNKLLTISSFFYSPKTQKEVFEPIVAEWQYEYFEDLRNKRFGRAKCTNLRWTYHFIAAMLQKSPIGDLIEFISKIAK